MTEKKHVLILFGGKSAEHEVSLQSAQNVYEAIDKNKYEVSLIGIDRDGKWYLNNAQALLDNSNPDLIKLHKTSENLSLIPGDNSTKIMDFKNNQSIDRVDVVFPLLHGPFGEDGTIQGFLKLAGLPFVGAGVLGSAIGMDKDVMKRLLRDAGIPVAKFLTFKIFERTQWDYKKILKILGSPFFVKPANLGSSVGIHKIHNASEYENCVKDALQFDTKLIFEEAITGREIECSVMGNDNSIASIPGEVIAQHEFYDYEAKYIDNNGALLKIPAELPKNVVNRIQQLAIETFQTLCCDGMARVDFFLKSNGEVIVNELNSIPGFTKISMYPKLWQASGISYTELIDKLIELALEKFEQESRLKTSYK
jgi:D-alanine-D-alanine ligase